MPSIIVGLGNPGSGYAKNRHTSGFMVADAVASSIVAGGVGGGWREKFHGHWVRGTAGGKDVLVLKPMTYMNLSGTSVEEAATFYKTPVGEVIVVHDELDLPFGVVQVKLGGGHAGHNGLRSIFEHFGKDFVRVRCGIGRPKFGDVSNYVLGDFGADEAPGVEAFIQAGVKAVELVLSKGIVAAQNAMNPKAKPGGK